MGGVKNRSKQKDLPLGIDTEYLISLWEVQKGKCAVSGIEFNLASPEIAGEPRFDSPSVDRIEPSLGYTKGNVRLVIYQINMAIGPYGLSRFLETVKRIKENV